MFWAIETHQLWNRSQICPSSILTMLKLIEISIFGVASSFFRRIYHINPGLINPGSLIRVPPVTTWFVNGIPKIRQPLGSTNLWDVLLGIRLFLPCAYIIIYIQYISCHIWGFLSPKGVPKNSWMVSSNI